MLHKIQALVAKRGKKKVYTVAFGVGVLLFTVLIYNSWFLDFGVRTHGDWGFYVKQAADTLRGHYFSVWLSDTSFGRILPDLGQAPSYAPYGWLSYYFGFSFAIAERMVHLWPAVLLAPIGSFMLARHVFKDKVAALLGMVVYSYNTYFLTLQTGHLTLAAAYALAPLAIYTYIRALETRTLLYAILAAFALAACGAYEPRSAYILILLLLLYGGFYFVGHARSAFRQKGMSEVLKIVVVCGAPLFIFLLLNIYWLLPLLKLGPAAGQGAIENSLFGSQYFNIAEAFTLFQPYWSGGKMVPFVTHLIPLYFWLIPIAAFGGFIALRKRNAYLNYFCVVGLLGVFLTKQSGGPFTGIYNWLFHNLPGFNAFREASKFYLLVALAYSILIPAFYLYVKKRYDLRFAKAYALAGILALLFLPNLIPIATNKIGATFSQRSMPAGYRTLNAFLDQPGYYRTLWVPKTSRWALDSFNHPTVDISKVLANSWKDLQSTYPTTDNATPTDEINEFLRQDYVPVLLSNAGIKYVVVPLRDVDNADNFYRSYNDDPSMFADTLAQSGYLKEANIHLDGFKVFEAATPIKPYFSATTNLYAIDSTASLPAAYSLWKNAMQAPGEFNFVTDQASAESPYVSNIHDMYYGLNYNQGKITAQGLKNIKNKTYYADQAHAETSYAIADNVATFSTQKLASSAGAAPVGNSVRQNLSMNGSSYIYEADGRVNAVVETPGTHYIGSPRQDVPVYAVNPQNIMPPPQKAHNTLWNEQVENCVPYGSDAPNIDIGETLSGVEKQPVMGLFAKDHAACTGPGAVPVSAGKYLLQFNYQASHAQFMSYRLSYNVPGQPPVTQDIAVADGAWHLYQKVIDVPQGATTLTLTLIGRPSNQMNVQAATLIKGVSLQSLQQVLVVNAATGDMQQIPAPANPSQSYAIDIHQATNNIANPSFEKGLWQKKVDDCDAYDANADLKMALSNNASDGKHSLELSAKRHVACTSQGAINVVGGKTYLLQFDYQSPNATSASYAISFDDEKNTRLSESIDITDTKWHTYSKQIQVPQNAKSATIAVFAHSDANSQSIYYINRYDNFKLQQVPDVKQRFYEVSAASVAMAKPKSTTFKNLDSTHKQVSIQGASGPFILLMSEEYDTHWHLLFGDKKPTTSPHFKVNNFENGWFVDPQRLCTQNPYACHKNADGTYDISLAVQFDVEKLMKAGLIVSTGTLMAGSGTIIWLVIRKRNGKKERNDKTRRQ
ncbi:MAG TPA: hypothetical protein VJR27_03375 [Candidatus Saccharimonadales bacterium]|nr:hypothetical protein [Candidatus Saccharimonadales bacterium]